MKDYDKILQCVTGADYVLHIGAFVSPAADKYPEETMNVNIGSPLEWECAFGHEFKATPNLVLKGGHWCPECERSKWNFAEMAKVNPFFAQVWTPIHGDEDAVVIKKEFNDLTVNLK